MEGFPQTSREHVVPTEEMLNDLAELYKIFGDSTRIKILYTLFDQARGVGEIAQELQVSRQGVYDNLNRAEALLTNMEQKTGCVRRDLQCRKVLRTIEEAAKVLENHPDSQVRQTAAKILSAAQGLEE